MTRATSATFQTKKEDFQQEITDTIITLLEQVDLNDYQSPFAALAAQGIPLNPTTKNYYKRANIVSLWFNQQAKQFSSNHWATYKQWKEQGATVRKGEKGSRVIFYKTLQLEKEATAASTNGTSGLRDSHDDDTLKIPMLRLYTVFNANQVDGYEAPATALPQTDKVARIAMIETFCTATGATILPDGTAAYYDTVKDCITMPPTHHFLESASGSATEQYYATLLHELTHWTGAEKRLNRPGFGGVVTTQDYALEELIAELGSAFLCAQFGVLPALPENHARYIKSWLRALQDDKTYIFKAAAQASRAFDYVNQFSVEV